MSSLPKVLFAVAAGAVGVSAHGYVSSWVVDGVAYDGWEHAYQWYQNPPLVAAWAAFNADNGPVFPASYATDDIICQYNSKNAKAHIEVKAGSQISIQWTAWPDTSHWGPIIDYLAPCNPDCETVDKSTLKFFKVDAVGRYNDDKSPGVWATDVMRQNNNAWLMEIPSTIAPGPYVLRNEIIALHEAEYFNKTQNYPQCVNLMVTGTGTDKPDGTLGTDLYKETDPGIFVNIYNSLPNYDIPGPAMYTGGTILSQSSVKPTATGTATPGAGMKRRRAPLVS